MSIQIATDDDRPAGIPQTLQPRINCFKHRSHLPCPARGFVDHVEVSVADGEDFSSDLNVDQYPESPADTTLLALEIIFATREPDYLRLGVRMPRKYRVAVKRRRILAGERQFITDSFGELQVFLTGNSVRRDRPAKFPGHIQIAGAQHSIVQLIYQKQVCKSEYRMGVQDFNDPVEVRSAFSIPLNNSEKRPQSGCGPLRRIDSRLIKQTLQFTEMVPVKPRAPKLIKCLEAEQLSCQVLIG